MWTSFDEVREPPPKALELAEAGVPVFPCRADKAPACPGGFKAASTDEEEVCRLWRRYPGPVVGIPAGKASGFTVLDIDPKHGGDVWLDEHFDRLPKTWVHDTRSGGFHLLFHYEHGQRSSAGKIAPGVDVRAEGGYIIWWPAAGFPVLCNAPLASWPEWLGTARPSPVTPRRAEASQANRVPDGRALAGLIRTVANAPEGTRNEVTFWASCRLGEYVRAGFMAHADAMALAVGAAMEAGLSADEATRTAGSGIGSSDA